MLKKIYIYILDERNYQGKVSLVKERKASFICKRVNTHSLVEKEIMERRK